MIVDSAILLAELVALFFGVTFAVYLVQRRLGSERLRAWMGGSPVASAVKGIGIGFVTPFCTYSAIPMLIGLRQARVPPAGYVAFITAAPVLDPVMLGALILIVGPWAAALYVAVAFSAALGLALLAQRSNIESLLKPLPVGPPALAGGAARSTVAMPSEVVTAAHMAESQTPIPALGEATDGDPADDGFSAGDRACAASACDDETPWQGLRAESVLALRSAVALLRSIAWILLAGLAVGMAIEMAVSPEDVAAITGDNGAFAIPIAAALGTPLYIETSLFIPIADALAGAGVGVGAIVALTISGAGANIPEFVILTKLAQRRLIVVFIGYVFAVALVGGTLAHLLLA